MEKSKRIFTAVRFPESTINQIAEVQEKLKVVDPKARFVKPISNFHITLYYIGNVTDLTPIDQAFEAACVKYQNEVDKKINVEFSDLGFFKNRGGNILWLGIKPNENLNTLYQFVIEELKKTDLNIKASKYKPHITIARKFKGNIDIDFIKPESVLLDTASLVWSHRNSEDILMYDNLSTYSLIKLD